MILKNNTKLGIKCDCGCGSDVTVGNRFVQALRVKSRRGEFVRGWTFVSKEHFIKWYAIPEGPIATVRTDTTMPVCSACKGSGKATYEDPDDPSITVETEGPCDICGGGGVRTPRFHELDGAIAIKVEVTQPGAQSVLDELVVDSPEAANEWWQTPPQQESI